ncbi:hypothetical protein IT575_13760 [bacterium]|nr:hypothetical protein [bacterium]
MLIVREVFTAKPGQASKLARLFKRSMAGMANVRVLTDFVGDYNTVVMEMEFEDLAAWQRMMDDYKSGKVSTGDVTPEEWAAYNTMWKTGRREIWQVVE